MPSRTLKFHVRLSSSLLSFSFSQILFTITILPVTDQSHTKNGNILNSLGNGCVIS